MISIGDAYRMGGWGMIPTTIFGLGAVSQAGLAWLTGDRRHLGRALGLAAATTFSGMLGFTTGVIKTIEFAIREDASSMGRLILTGVMESAYNLGLTGVLMVVLSLVIGPAIGRQLAR